MKRHYVTGLFRDEAGVQDAAERLSASFPVDEIGILVGDQQRVEEAPIEHKTGIAPAGVAGASLGGSLGALGATLVSVGSLPALGVGLLAAGPIAAAATGALTGAAGGGLLGALAGLGFWEETPDLPDRIRDGAALVSVPAEGPRAELARAALREAGAEWVTG